MQSLDGSIFLTVEPSTKYLTVDRRHGSAFDNAEYHVTSFRPISEASHSWSYDKVKCIGPGPIGLYALINNRVGLPYMSTSSSVTLFVVEKCSKLFV